MNQEQISGKLDELKGKLKEGWGEVTGDAGAKISGLEDQVKGRLKQDHGEAQGELNSEQENRDRL